MSQPNKMFQFSIQVAVGSTLLFLVTIVVIGTLSFRSFKSDLNEILLGQQRILLERIAKTLDQKLVTMQQGLTLSATKVSPPDVTSSEVAQRYLDANSGLQALFDRSIFLFSPTGKIIAEHPYLAKRRGQDFSWRDYIKDTLRTQAPVISEPFVTTKDDKNAVLMLTAPVYAANGELIAILSGSLGLTRPAMLGEIAKTVIGQSGYLYLVSSDGRLIMHPDKKRLLHRAFVAGTNPLFENALKGHMESGQTIEPDGRRVLTSYQRIPSSGWIVAAVYPEEEAFLPFDRLVLRFIQVLILACAITLGSIWYFTRGLARKLQTTNQMLEQMQANASHKLVVRSQYFQEASHDFRQRLHAMLLLIHSAERSTSKETAVLLGKITWAVEELQCYVKHFLEFARLETTIANPVLRKVHLQDIFHKLELRFEDVALERNVDLRFRATNILVNTDEEMLFRIQENLISNAIKFARGRVLVGARRRNTGISIEVWDNGAGIPLGERETIFEAFYQGTPYVDPQQEGLGLGLAIVRRLATSLGYTLDVNAREGHGSVIKVFVPQQDHVASPKGEALLEVC